MKALNKYEITIKNLDYKKAKAVKRALASLKIPAKISIISLELNELKYCCYLSKFDK